MQFDRMYAGSSAESARARIMSMMGLAASPRTDVDPNMLEHRDTLAKYGADPLCLAKEEYSLWTGDLGFAVYLWQCVAIESGFPTVDFF